MDYAKHKAEGAAHIYGLGIWNLGDFLQASSLGSQQSMTEMAVLPSLNQ
jgi:hypothetical protein